MPPRPERRPATIALFFGAVMGTVFVGLVLRYDHDLRAVIHQKMIQRDAAVLTSVAQQEIETGTYAATGANPGRWLAALLPAAHRRGLLALAIFDADGIVLEKIPANQLLVELPPDDFVRLQDGRPLTRYWPDFAVGTMLTGGPREPTPVLEIVLPLRGKSSGPPPNGADSLIGFVRYHLDARTLATELATLDAGVRRQTVVTLTVGLATLGLLMGAAYAMLGRAQRTIAEHRARLERANFELTLSAKASALGQITSHLIHGLQGPVAGLRAVVAGRAPGEAGSDWRTAADYAERMQAMIQETVALLGDSAAHTTYELTGHELAAIIHQRNLAPAGQKGVGLFVRGGFAHPIDSHRGGLLCLITSNLVQNAIEATVPGRNVTVTFAPGDGLATVDVADEGAGIPAEVRAHLFEPGRSGRPGGSGLGLAISQLLARQIGATLALHATGPEGTTFRLTLPLAAG